MLLLCNTVFSTDHAMEIRTIAERADKDLAIESAIKTFEEVWLSRVFELRPLINPLSTGNKVTFCTVAMLMYVHNLLLCVLYIYSIYSWWTWQMMLLMLP